MQNTTSLAQKRKKQKLYDKLANILLFVIVILVIFPIAWMVFSSLLTQNQISTGKIGVPNNFKNYIDMWKNINFFIISKIV